MENTTALNDMTVIEIFSEWLQANTFPIMTFCHLISMCAYVFFSMYPSVIVPSLCFAYVITPLWLF